MPTYLAKANKYLCSMGVLLIALLFFTSSYRNCQVFIYFHSIYDALQCTTQNRQPLPSSLPPPYTHSVNSPLYRVFHDSWNISTTLNWISLFWMNICVSFCVYVACLYGWQSFLSAVSVFI